MKIKFIKITGVFCLSLLIFSRVSGQTLLTQAFLSGAEGVNVVTNSLNLTIGYARASPTSIQLQLFQNVWVQTGDIGQVYTLGPSDDPIDFALFTHDLTDGVSEFISDLALCGPGGGGKSTAEADFFSSLPPGSNGIDLKGFNVDYYTLVFTSLKFDSPGSDPNNNGLWTDSSYSAVFSVYGEPVPEPASLTLLCLVLGVLLTKAKWPNKSLQPIPINDIGICDGPGGAVVCNSPLSPGVAELLR